MTSRKRNGLVQNPLVVVGIVAALLVSGAWVGEWRVRIADEEMRAGLLHQARSIAQAIDPELVARLTFTAADRATPAFALLRNQLTSYGRLIKPRGVYTLALRDGNLVFGPETYDENDPMASPPGTIYQQPQPADYEIFASGLPYTTGPDTDEYGTFVSALAPVVVPETGEVAMVVGIDILADTWRADLNTVRRPVWVVACALATIYVSIALAIGWRDRQGSHTALWLRHLETLGVALSGLILTALATLIVRDAETRDYRRAILATSDSHVEAVASTLQDISNGIAAAVRFHGSSQRVDCRELSIFAGPLASSRAIQGFYWIRVVKASEIPALEAEARSDGIPDFHVWQSGREGERVATSDAGLVYPIRCAEPWSDSQAQIGLDMGSVPHWRATLEAAAKTGLTAASDAYPLAFAENGELGILIARPIYAQPDSERDQGTRYPIGFMAAEVGLQSLVDLALKPYQNRGSVTPLHLADLRIDGSLQLVATHPDEGIRGQPAIVDTSHADRFTITEVRPLFAHGQAWAIVTHASEAERSLSPWRGSWAVAVAGTLLSALSAAYIGSLRGREMATELLVRRRTTELRESEEKYRRLAETALRQLDELSTLHAVATTCARAADEDQLIMDLTHLVGEALYTDDFGLLLTDEAGVSHPHPSYHQREGKPVSAIRPGNGTVGQVVLERRPRRVDDAQTETNFIADSPTTRSELAVPVKIGERVIAVINAESPEVGRFSTDDERLLVTIAGQLATAIERLRLEQGMRRQLAELEALHNASQEVIAAGIDPERVYASVQRVVARLMPAEAFTIALNDPASGDIEVVYAIDKGGRAPTIRLRAGEGMTGYVIAHGESIVIDESHPHNEIAIVHFGTPDPVRSYLAVPLRANDEVIGVLTTQSYRPTAFTAHDLVLLETVANHVAAALSNIRLFHQSLGHAQRIQAILDSVPEGVLLVDHRGRVILANPAAESELSQLAQVDGNGALVSLGGRPFTELIATPPEGLGHEIRSDGRIYEVTPRPASSGPEPESYVVLISDVTHARQVQNEMSRQERLAAVGQLAAGIAHDFNNILAVIVLYAQMGLQDKSLPTRLRSYIATISDQAHHAASLVQQILDFGRRAMLDPQPVNLVAFVTEQAALLARTLPDDIRVEIQAGASDADASDTPASIYVSADVTRLQQLVTNLAINARDAMPEGGTLTMSVMRLTISEGDAAPLVEMAPGRWAKLEMRDTGSGMDADVQAHLFEPFFTTKGPGQGTGLGLAQVYGIVKQHHGHIQVHTAPGTGTAFDIYLPLLDRSPLPGDPERSQACTRGQGEVILVVEDNATVREAVVRTLEVLDYRTVEAANGQEALAVLERSPEDIALVLSDWVMPEMGGRALLQAMERRGIDLPVVFLSGHPANDELQTPQEHSFAGWLGKPPTIEALSAVLANTLVRSP